MGNAATNELPNTITSLTNTNAIVNSLQNDPSMPKTAQGSVVMEVPGQANPQLQSWIINNTTQGAAYIPGQSPYTASNAALNAPKLTSTPINVPVTAACANNDLACRSGVGAQQTSIPQLTQAAREAIADGASTTSRQAGVIGAAATAATAAGSPQMKPITGSVAIGATVIGVAADVVEQVMRPDTGQAAVNLGGSLIGIAIDAVPNAKFVTPVTNEVVEAIKSSPVGKTAQDFVNGVLAEDKKK
jgi:hypothetical protein